MTFAPIRGATPRYADELRRLVLSGAPSEVDIPQQFRAYRRAPIEERFWSKVDKSGGCWLWLGYRTKDGYGQFPVGSRTKRRAHRVAYLLSVGPIPQGMQLDHLCRNPPCVNPMHLDVVTNAENSARGNSPGALAVRTNRCKRDHEFTPENTYVRPDTGHRFCRQCIAIRRRGAA